MNKTAKRCSEIVPVWAFVAMVRSNTFFILFIVSIVGYGQEFKDPGASKQIQAIYQESNAHFLDGLRLFSSNTHKEAQEAFDQSVEVFLRRGITAGVYSEIQICFDKLTETLYRIEFPNSKQLPDFDTLVLNCEWKWNETDRKRANELRKSLAENKTKARPNSQGPGLRSSGNELVGFKSQEFNGDPLDELATLTLLESERSRGIVDRPAMKIVKAQAGDIVAKVALRHGADPQEVARVNGLLQNSVLGAGREIRIPVEDGRLTTFRTRPVDANSKSKTSVDSSPGPKPTQLKNGVVPAVLNYFNEHFDDPYSMRIVRWSSIVPRKNGSLTYWVVVVKFRAKNRAGAYELREEAYYIREDQVRIVGILY